MYLGGVKILRYQKTVKVEDKSDKICWKIFFQDFLISLNFHSSEVHFVAIFCRFSWTHSILGLGHFIRSQSMLEMQIWINWLPLLQVSNSTIKRPSGGLCGLGISTKDIFQSVRSQWSKKGQKNIKNINHCASGLWFGLYDLHDLFWPFYIILSLLNV